MSNIREYSFKSVSGLGDIFVRSYSPESEKPKAIVQIAHGMSEHMEYYNWIAEKLTNAGFTVYINDHIGHGKSVTSDDMLGFFGDTDGWKNFIYDQRKVTEIAKKENPDIPFITMGHSMGSFISRAYTEMYKDADGAIYLGTSGPQPTALGAMVANLVAKLHGKMHRSAVIEKIAFGTYNLKFEKRTAFDWLTTDQSFVDRYLEDKYCGFRFTAYGYRDLFNLIGYISADSWYDGVPKDTPILMLAGDMDPVGNYGKGVTKVYNKLKATRHNVECKLFRGARHVVLEETEKEQAAQYIIDFVNKIIEK